MFSLHLMDNIFALYRELDSKTYRHGLYHAFRINDPKPRDIHKAEVRDRLVHHAIYQVLYPYFDRQFIFDSFSCRLDKGTHRAINRFQKYGRIVSRNHTRTIWVLKCDVKKFFANIDHQILLKILKKRLDCNNLVWLLDEIIESFNTDGKSGTGLPLGNLTSQLFVNIYMNEFDHFLKRELKVKYFIRYADDLIVIHENKKYLEDILPKISEFMRTKLRLRLHPKKIFIKTIASGVDFLGWVHFPHHRVLRTATKRRMLKRLKQNAVKKMLVSYLGLLRHGNTYNLTSKIKEMLQFKE